MKTDSGFAEPTYSEIANNGWKLIFWGVASPFAEKAFSRLKGQIISVVDNKKALQGTRWREYEVMPVESLAQIDFSKEVKILLCTADLGGVREQLDSLGIEKEAAIIPEHLVQFLPVSRIQDVRFDFLLTSGAVAPGASTYMSGAYLYDSEFFENSLSYEPRKIVSGPCHGIGNMEDGFLIGSDDHGLVVLDKGLEVRDAIKIDSSKRVHGVSCRNSKVAYGLTGTDEVVILDLESGTEDLRFSVSAKAKKFGADQHHINDVLLGEHSVYVSMFSASGNYRNGIYDGVVQEYDLDSGKLVGPLFTGLRLPHSISFFDESFHVIDSLRGNLIGRNGEIVSHFRGFARGLDKRDGIFVVGQSPNRNSGNVMGLADNIGVDATVSIYDPDSRLSTEYSFPRTMSEIHAIKVLT